MSGDEMSDAGLDLDAETAAMFEELGVAYFRWGKDVGGTKLRYEDIQRIKALIRARLERVADAARAAKPR